MKDKLYSFEPYIRTLFVIGLISLFLGNLYFQEILQIQTHIIIFTLITGFFTFYLNRNNIETEFEEKGKKEELNKTYIIIFVILILIGLTIRLYRLGELGFWWDEEATSTAVTRILETGRTINPDGVGYYTRGIAYSYFVSIFAYIFGNTEFWIRFPSVLFGLGIAIMSFFFTKKINKTAALLVLFFLVFSTYNIQASQFARFYVMNTFLMMLAIWFFWEGFFKNKLKYKILSLLTFFLMLHTSEFGMIFVALIPTWGIFFLQEILTNLKNFKKVLRKNLSNIFLLVLSIPIYYVGNSLDTLLRLRRSSPEGGTEVIQTVAATKNWVFLQPPEWDLIKFFYNDYSALIILPFIFIPLVSVFLLLKKKKNFISYLGFFTIFSILAYEIGNSGIIAFSRIYFFIEGILALFLILFIFYITKLYIKSKKAHLITNLVILFFIFLSIKPLFYERLTINYGDSVENDPFRTTHVAPYRADNKTTNEFVRENKKNNDIVIVLHSLNYYYLREIPDYTFSQHKMFTQKEPKPENVLTTTKELESIIAENQDKRIWFVVNGASINILSTSHINQSFRDFLTVNEQYTIYESPDNYSKVLLFNENKMPQ